MKVLCKRTMLVLCVVSKLGNIHTQQDINNKCKKGELGPTARRPQHFLTATRRNANILTPKEETADI